MKKNQKSGGIPAVGAQKVTLDNHGRLDEAHEQKAIFSRGRKGQELKDKKK